MNLLLPIAVLISIPGVRAQPAEMPRPRLAAVVEAGRELAPWARNIVQGLQRTDDQRYRYAQFRVFPDYDPRDVAAVAEQLERVALKDSYDQMRSWCILSLEQIGELFPAQGVPSLERLARGAKDEDDREKAFAMLEFIGLKHLPEVAPIMIGIAGDEASPDVRRLEVMRLGDLAGNGDSGFSTDQRNVLDAVVEHLRDDPSEQVRYFAAEALGRNARVVAATRADLERALRDDKDILVRHSAARSLLAGGPALAAPALEPFIQQQMADALSDDPQKREMAIHGVVTYLTALGRFDEALPVALRMIETETDPRIRWIAAESLRQAHAKGASIETVRPRLEQALERETDRQARFTLETLLGR